MTPSIDSTSTVAQIVLDHPETARIFGARRIDYCCGGDVPLARLCAHRGLDLDVVKRELEAAVAAADAPSETDPRALRTPALVARIVDRHHGYLRSALPFLEQIARKVARVHGDHDPRLLRVLDELVALRAKLEAHLELEEDELFPQLVSAKPDRAVVARELDTMMSDHREVGAALEKLRMLTDDHVPPEWACASYRALLAEMARLEDDVMRHVHLENHVLMPRFVEAS